MEIKIIEGDLLETTCIVIAHQVNCMGVMGSGVARGIKEKWIDVYLKYLEGVKSLDHNCLGGCLIVQAEENKYVANLFGQYYYNGFFNNPQDYMKQDFWKRPEFDDNGKTVRFTNYEALYNSLVQLKNEMTKNNVPSVAFPYGLGSARGGGDWNIIETMIKSVFQNTGIYIELRKFNPGPIKSSKFLIYES